MTKRDVAIWFCKVVALAGIFGAAFNLLGALFGWRIVGAGNFFSAIPTLGLYVFVWLFASGIGTELAAEGEHGAPIQAGAELGTLVVRCAGLWLFLSASTRFGIGFLFWVYSYFFSNITTSFVNDFMVVRIVGGFLQSTVGFLLAFTPRIRAFLSSR